MDTEIRVFAKLSVQPDQIDHVIEAFRILANMTRRERGCLQYELHQEIHDPAILIFFEKWKTLADFKDHLRTPYFVECLQKVSSLVVRNETRIIRKI
jgi:quinol monooxygenase YgiN